MPEVSIDAGPVREIAVAMMNIIPSNSSVSKMKLIAVTRAATLGAAAPNFAVHVAIPRPTK